MGKDKPVYVTKPSLPPMDEFVNGLIQIWDSNMLTNFGPYYIDLQDELQKFLDVKNISLFVNGHQALEIAISSLQISGEIITTPFTFASTTHAIVRSGLKPVFCDIKLTDCNIDETKIEALINENTSAILPVHVYGNPCNVKVISEIAEKYNLKLIFDAAHAFGVDIDGNGIGNYGDISMFSFHATKVFNTIEGGALTFSEESLSKELYLRQNFGIESAEEILLPGTNAKMNEFQALMGLLNLKHIDNEIDKRKKKATLYKESLLNVGGIRVITTPFKSVKHNHAYFPIFVDEKEYGITRDALVEYLNRNNIFPRKYFFPPITEFQCYKGKFGDTPPITEYIANRIMCLPLWGDIEDQVITKICTIIANKEEVVGD